MTNKEILQASLLDIVFENRNKAYGAYALRNGYDKRLMKALAIGLGTVMLFILFNFLELSRNTNTAGPNEKDGYVLSVVELEPEKLPEPEKPRPMEKPQVAQVDYQDIKVVPDNMVEDILPETDDINRAAVSNVTSGGKEDDGSDVEKPVDKGGSGVVTEKEPEIPPVKIYQRDPQFPGGYEALSDFLRKNLVTPEELEVGEKKIVKVKFIVGKDGTITDILILESPGKIYDKEVSRVMKRMPKWEPAIQNDINVAVGYVLPVTFMGVEE